MSNSNEVKNQASPNEEVKKEEKEQKTTLINNLSSTEWLAFSLYEALEEGPGHYN